MVATLNEKSIAYQYQATVFIIIIIIIIFIIIIIILSLFLLSLLLLLLLLLSSSVLQTAFSMLFLEWKLLWSLKYVPRSPVSIKHAFVQIMTWHRTDKPLSESIPPPPNLLLTHICWHMYASLDHNATLPGVMQIWHIEAETKWPPFSRRHFQMDFLEWKCMNFD